MFLSAGNLGLEALNLKTISKLLASVRYVEASFFMARLTSNVR